MGSFNHCSAYDPLDLEILEHVYEAAWARVEADHLHRDPSADAKLQAALRKWVFALAGNHPVNFDELMEQMDGVPTSWLIKVVDEGEPFPVESVRSAA